ncbi:MAG: ion transporter, partial [Candidatus Riflebacteria bacterium]|nr:ion transporter [Candidatus Riflebacteria bacterium]
MPSVREKDGLSPRQKYLHEIIFEAETPAGKLFDVLLILFILASIATVMLDSVKSIRDANSGLFSTLDWIFTFFFTLDYIARLYSVSSPRAYAASFYGVIDLLAVIPGYLGLIFPGAQYLSVVRIFRVLRVFRILKFAHYLDEADLLFNSLRASRKRITVFVIGVMALVVFIGSAIYVIEGDEN